ncbi:MAG: 1-deoxy-D-xylulose-5-phosphate reductoisomerase, partial [Actinomycetes bacterium]
MSRSIVLLGSTGSIGTQALDIVARNRDRFDVLALGAGGGNTDVLAHQVLDTGARLVALADPDAAEGFLDRLERLAHERGVRPGDYTAPRVVIGSDAATDIAGIGADVVLNGMTGSVGLAPTLAALEAGSILALANKESLVVGGTLVTRAARDGQIVPVDSEHSALAQCLRGGDRSEVRRLVLTASGGPFRGWSADRLAGVTPEQALDHPTWKMGPVVTINSATLVNKGLEVIEAHLLFDIGYDRIDVVVHPQSMVHSMVEFFDGSTLAQVSPPDMRLPIAMGLAWPQRVRDAAAGNDWSTAAQWTFEPLDEQVFSGVRVARRVGGLGGTAPAVFNAANEQCVNAFLSGALDFAGIMGTVEQVVDVHLMGTGGSDGSQHVPDASVTVTDVLAAETWARRFADSLIASKRTADGTPPK